MFEQRFFQLGRSLVPQLEVAEDIPEGRNVRNAAEASVGLLPSACVEGARHGEAEVEDVRVQQVQLLPQEHGQGLVTSVGLHLVPGNEIEQSGQTLW